MSAIRNLFVHTLPSIFLLVLFINSAAHSKDANSQQSLPDRVLLKWNVSQDSPLVFKTSMDTVPEDTHVAFNFGAMLALETDETGTETSLSGRGVMFDDLELPGAFSMMTVMQPKHDGSIEIKMLMTEAEFNDEDAEEFMNSIEDAAQKIGKNKDSEETAEADGKAEDKEAGGSGEAADEGESKTHEMSEEDKKNASQMLASVMRNMLGSVMLRGIIDESGELLSFYIPDKQKGVINLFFQLPKDPVAVGDTWALDASFISVDASFICEEAKQVNIVQLDRIERNESGELVAVLLYYIYESVEGQMANPMNMFGDMMKDQLKDEIPEGVKISDTIPTALSMRFAGRGEFLVDQGRWQKYVGVIEASSSGLMSMETTQSFALVPTSDFPKEILQAR